MSSRSTVAALVCTASLIVSSAESSAVSAAAAKSVGTPGQIAWVRSAATRFVMAELAGDGASACDVLNAPLRATEHGRTCAQRWDARLTRLLRESGTRTRLRAQKRAIASAAVVVRGGDATISLPTPPTGSENRFVWSENCWMLAG